MTISEVPNPEPIDYKTARVLKQELCRALGFDPSDVVSVEVAAAFIKVTDRNRVRHVLTTQNLSAVWTAHYPAGYDHAVNLKG